MQFRMVRLLSCYQKLEVLNIVLQNIILCVVLYGCSTWSLIKGRIHIDRLSEHGAGENVSPKEARRLEKIS
jgi:hypothetical protein